MQLVEAHLIPGAMLRAADLKPGVLYPTALAVAFLTVRSIHVSWTSCCSRPRVDGVIHWHVCLVHVIKY